jgi:spore maturation protein B
VDCRTGDRGNVLFYDCRDFVCKNSSLTGKKTMKFLLFLSEAIVPLLLFLIIIVGLSKKINLYEDFISGVRDGFRTVAGILPTLLGLMIAVGVLRASGLLDFVTSFAGKLLAGTKIPEEILPLAVIKLFSSSAATGLLLDLYQEYGTDSTVGRIASVMLSSTETVFYTMSVYFMSVKVKKSRYTLAGALFATVVGIIASIWVVSY